MNKRITIILGLIISIFIGGSIFAYKRYQQTYNNKIESEEIHLLGLNQLLIEDSNKGNTISISGGDSTFKNSSGEIKIEEETKSFNDSTNININKKYNGINIGDDISIDKSFDKLQEYSQKTFENLGGGEGQSTICTTKYEFSIKDRENEQIYVYLNNKKILFLQFVKDKEVIEQKSYKGRYELKGIKLVDNKILNILIRESLDNLHDKNGEDIIIKEIKSLEGCYFIPYKINIKGEKVKTFDLELGIEKGKVIYFSTGDSKNNKESDLNNYDDFGEGLNTRIDKKYNEIKDLSMEKKIFIEDFRSCKHGSSIAITTNILSDITYKITILGKESGKCKIEGIYIKNSNSDLINKPMICLGNNELSSEELKDALFYDLVNNKLFNLNDCNGPLKDTIEGINQSITDMIQGLK